MRTIYKYKLELTDDQVVNIKSPATILSVQMQGNSLCLWAEVITDSVDYPQAICIRGTGQPMKGNEGKFIGTVQVDNLVFHVFAGAKPQW